MYERYFTSWYISAGALRDCRCFLCVSVSPMISIRIPMIYVQYPFFERDHPYYRVYKSVCSRPPWNRARNISSAQRFYGSCGTPKGMKEREGKSRGIIKRRPYWWPSLSRVSRPFLLSFSCASVPFLSTPRDRGRQ